MVVKLFLLGHLSDGLVVKMNIFKGILNTAVMTS